MHDAAAAAPPASSRCGGTRSASVSTAETTAPTAKPSCTDVVSHTPAVADRSHSARSSGSTADAENHTASPSTWTSATSARARRPAVMGGSEGRRIRTR